MVITTKEELKRKLKSSWVLSLKVEELHYQLKELEATGTKVTPSYSLAPAGGGDNNTSKPEQAALAIYELKQEINAKIEQQCAAVRETYRLIDLLDDELLKLVMIKRYAKHKPWKEIAVEMGYSWRQVHNLHSKALNMIVKKM